MAGAEKGRNTGELDVGPTIVEIIHNLTSNSWSESRFSVDEIAELVEEARTGREVEIPLISGVFTPLNTNERRRLERRFPDNFVFADDEWQRMMVEYGQPIAVTHNTDLRDPETGRITDPMFIIRLYSSPLRHDAVVLSQRPDIAGGSIPVFDTWTLWRDGETGDHLPIVHVYSFDADAIDKVAVSQPNLKDSPSHTIMLDDVFVGEKLVLLPFLELPELPASD